MAAGRRAMMTFPWVRNFHSGRSQGNWLSMPMPKREGRCVGRALLSAEANKNGGGAVAVGRGPS